MKQSRFLDQVREVIRRSQFSYSTEKTYISWIYRFIIYHRKKYPGEMGGKEVAQFLTYLAVERKVSASTQNQALNALAFLYRSVLKIPLDRFDFRPGRIGKRLPVVLGRIPGSLFAGSTGSEVPGCGEGIWLAIYFSRKEAGHGSRVGRIEATLPA